MSLTTTPVSEVLKGLKSGPIFVATLDDSIKTVLTKLASNNIQSLPVIDAESNVLGIVSNVDILDFLVRVSTAAKESRVTPVSINLKDDDLDMLLERSADFKLTTVNAAFGVDPLSKVIQTRQPFLPVTDGVPLSAVLEIFQKTYRVPVVNKEKANEVTAILTQSDVNAYLANHPELLGNRGSLTLVDLGLVKGIDSVVTVSETVPAIDAFTLLTDKGLTSVGIVNENGALLGVLSATDLKLVKDFKFKQLLLPVLQFVKNIRSEKQQFKSYTVWVKPEATLEEVVKKLSAERVHRVYVVNAANKPISVVSLSDIAKVLSKLQ